MRKQVVWLVCLAAATAAGIGLGCQAAAPPPTAGVTPPAGEDPQGVPRTAARPRLLFGPDAVPSAPRPARGILPSVARGAAPRAAEAPSRGGLERVMLPELRVPVGADLARTLARVADSCGVNLLVHEQAREVLTDASGVELDLAGPVPAARALDLVTELASGAAGLDPAQALRWWVADGVIQVGVGGRGGRQLHTMVFDVSDLVRGLPSYPGREMQLWPSGGPLASATDGEPLERIPAIQEDLLVDLIRSTVLPGTWDEDGVSIRIANGKLIVQHYR